jgi:DNA-binding NarL/FixJ family response regulator
LRQTKTPSTEEYQVKIVHIEDDELDAELVRVALNAASVDCEIVRVATRDQFLAEMLKQQPDVVLSDSNLPGFDSSHALAFVRSLHPAIPFIYVTGNLSPRARQTAMDQGAAAFINKDDLRELISALRNVKKDNAAKPAFPQVDQVVVVRCPGFRCLGVRTADGKWMDYLNSTELTDVIEWFEI